jgi:hypothetical protein
MASVKVFPRLDKINKVGKAPIYLRIIKNRRSKYISLDVHIFPTEWNNTQGKVKSSARNASQINTYIAVKVAEAKGLPWKWKHGQNLLPLPILNPGY